MRTPTIAALLMATTLAPVAADAQRLGNGPMRDGRTWNDRGPVQPSRVRPTRWGGTFEGRWTAGTRAPGGWNAYRRPSRGWTLPRYWVAPNFYIGDYETYGLATPPVGYSWTRYYDDAVLVDARGRVWDSIGGVDWDRYADDYGSDGYGGGQYHADGGADYYSGRSDDRGVSYAPPREVVQSGGYSTTSYSSGYRHEGYASGGYWYPPATQTVVTVASAPVTTTTTTTEYIETRAVAPRRVWKARKVAWKPRPKVRSCTCVCSMVCR